MIWRSSYHRRIAQLADFSVALVSFVTAFIITGELHLLFPHLIPPIISLGRAHYFLAIVLSCVYVILFDKNKAYNYQRFKSLKREYFIVLKVTVVGTMVCIVSIFLYGFKEFPRTLILLNFGIGLIAFLLDKTILFYIALMVRRNGKDRKRILMIGSNERTEKFIENVKQNFSWGLDLIGILKEENDFEQNNILGIQIIGNLAELEYILKKENPEEVICTISTRRFDQIRDILAICEKEGVVVRLNSNFLGEITKTISVETVFDMNIISFNMVKQSEVTLFIKRVMDIIGAAIALTLFSPFMIIASIIILFTDGRPIFYTWNVVGLNKKPFRSWKFRTMVKNADELKSELSKQNEMEGPVFKIKNDPRILPIGKWLRIYSIDETPQLFSVIKGDMSLVGPRPAGPHELDRYESWHRRKLSVKPGITCLWQASGRNKIRKFDDWVKMDLEYIDNWSILLDIKILLKTIPAVLFGRGAS